MLQVWVHQIPQPAVGWLEFLPQASFPENHAHVNEANKVKYTAMLWFCRACLPGCMNIVRFIWFSLVGVTTLPSKWGGYPHPLFFFQLLGATCLTYHPAATCLVRGHWMLHSWILGLHRVQNGGHLRLVEIFWQRLGKAGGTNGLRPTDGPWVMLTVTGCST